MERRLAAYGLALMTVFGGQSVQADGLFRDRNGLWIEDPYPDEWMEPAFGFDIFNGRNGYVYGNGRNGNGSFCRNYRRIVLTRGDLASIRGTTRAVRNRIQANDLQYLCRCEGFRSPFCYTNGR